MTLSLDMELTLESSVSMTVVLYQDICVVDGEIRCATCKLQGMSQTVDNPMNVAGY